MSGESSASADQRHSHQWLMRNREKDVKRILVQETVCSGCRACELACVVWHEGAFGTALARIRVVKIEPDGLDVPNVCQLCRPPSCAAACPTEALWVDEASGVVRLRADECAACGACADACPYGMVTLHPTTGQPLICDLCDGDPACVARCATGAIRFAEQTEAGREDADRTLSTPMSMIGEQHP